MLKFDWLALVFVKIYANCEPARHIEQSRLYSDLCNVAVCRPVYCRFGRYARPKSASAVCWRARLCGGAGWAVPEVALRGNITVQTHGGYEPDATMRCKTGRTAVPNGTFHDAVRPVLHCQTGGIVTL